MIYINEKEVWVEEAYINALFLLVEKPREFMLGLLSKPFTIYYSSPINLVLKANAISGTVQNCLN